jgi:hypothetical protein
VAESATHNAKTLLTEEIPMQANGDAPVFATSEITIDAPASVVWEVMSRIDEWPRWNKDISDASLEGELKPGSVFRWKSGPGKIVSTLQTVDPPKQISWSGKTMGVTAIHVWQLEPRDGSTIVTTEESWEGITARLLRKWSQKTVERAMRDGLTYLKAEAERRAQQGRGPEAGE